MSVTQFWFGYIFPPSRLFEFILGMLLARAVATRAWPRIGIGPALALAVGGYAAALALPFVYGFNVATIVPVCALILAFAAADTAGERTGLAGRRARWLGEVSFGFYICQGVVVFYGRTLFGSRPFGTPVALLVVAALFGATLLAGWLLYSRVERPVMRRWAHARRTPAAPRPDQQAPRGSLPSGSPIAT